MRSTLFDVPLKRTFIQAAFFSSLQDPTLDGTVVVPTP
jgi:hypothetical protein